MRWYVIVAIVLSHAMAWADCLDFAAHRGFLPKSTDGLQGRLVLIDAPKRADIDLYVLMDGKWCFLPIAVSRKMCDLVERLPDAKTHIQGAFRTLTALKSIEYACQEVQGAADH